MGYQDFESKWLGQRTNIDGVENYQCVDLIKQFLKDEYGISPVPVGVAKNYWFEPHPTILEKLEKIPTTDVLPGDVVPLRPVDKQPNHQSGHVGIATGEQTTTTLEILEQNGSTGSGSGEGNNRIRKRWIPKSRVYGVLRLKSTSPAPVPNSPKMPPVGGRVRFLAGNDRTVFDPGTTRTRGTLRPRDNTWVYEVRGYDPKYQYRIILNSKSAGGNGGAVALYYTNGKLIPGWERA